MTINPTLILAAFGGGILGASMGGLPAITLWGAVLLVAGSAEIFGQAHLLWDIGFNPLFGAHIVYAGGAAAAAYAARRGQLESGLMIQKPLSSLMRADVLMVGGLFGVLGLLIQQAGAALALPTDTVALAVVALGWLSRFLFDRGWLRARRQSGAPWLPSRSELATLVVLGLGVGLAGGLASRLIGSVFIPFGLALLFLVYLQMGHVGFTWHHIVLIGGIVGLQTEAGLCGLIWAAVMGAYTAVVANLVDKATIPGTNSYIDPPVTSIAVGNSTVVLLGSIGLI